MLTRAGLLGLVAGVSLAAQFAAESAAAAEPLTIEQLYATPVRSGPDLSPDGSHYVSLISEDAVERIFVTPVAGGEAREIARFDDPEQRIRWVNWAKPEFVLVSLHEKGLSYGSGIRPRRTRLFSIPPSGGPRREYLRRRSLCGDDPTLLQNDACVGGSLQIQDEIVHTLPDDPRHVLIVYRDPLATVRRLNLETGRSRLIVRSFETLDGFAADADGSVRAGADLTGERLRLRARASKDADWKTVWVYETRDTEAGVTFLGFAPEPHKLYVSARHEGREALFLFDIESQQKQLVAAKPSSHLIAARFANGGRTLAAAYFDDEARELLDPAAVREQALLDAALPNARNEIVNESDRGGIVTIAASRGGSGLDRYLAFERATGKLTPLYAEREIPETDLVAPQQVGPSAALSMRAALTLPRAQAASGAAVVVVNCAESPDEVLGFDPEVQALASRDIAVLEIDLGHNAITGQQTLPWVERLSAAVGEAAAWLVQQGIADPKRVGVYGSGLGGYAAMAAAAREPARFRAVAALSPVTSLREFGRESATYGMRTWPAWVRDRRETRHAAAHREHFAEALRAPLFLAHGEEASFAHVSQSRALAKALRRAGRAVAYTELAGETDVPMRLASRARLYAEWVAFFERELAPPASKES